MSFTRVAPRSLNAIVRSTATPTLRVGGVRSISATAAKQKGPVEAAKDTLKKTDDVLSGAAVKGIEKGGMYPSSPLQLPLCDWILTGLPYRTSSRCN